MTRRCSECRARFEPAVTAGGHQQVCSSQCRKRRRARLARRRRRQDLDGYRCDERERQRRHRERKRQATPVAAQLCRGSPEACCGGGRESCHEPASARKPLDLREELLEIVDSSVRMSRASFEQTLTRMRRELSRISARGTPRRGQLAAVRAEVSRASFEL